MLLLYRSQPASQRFSFFSLASSCCGFSATAAIFCLWRRRRQSGGKKPLNKKQIYERETTLAGKRERGRRASERKAMQQQ
jgi:hypothetical protein